MSAIGRIFLILNLILAAVFLGFAANQLSQNTNVTASLAAERQAHESTKTTTGEQISTLTTQVNQLRTDMSALRDDHNQEQALAKRNGLELNEEKAANAQLRGEITGIKESLAGYNSTIASLTSQKDRLVTEKTEAFAGRDAAVSEKGKADAARRTAEEALQSAKGKITDLEVSVNDAKKDASALDTELKALYVVTNHPRIGTPQPLIEGAVVIVNNSIAPGLIAINKGSNDQVKRGYVFDVFQGTTYKGRAKVETVHDNTCSAVMIMPAPGTSVAQGDRVTTQL